MAFVARAISALISAALLAAPAAADCTDDAMIVFDGSGSMGALGFSSLSETRIGEARRAIRAAIPPVARIRRLGLIIYGPGGRGGSGVTRGCDAVDLRFAPRADAAGGIIDAIERLQPAGPTPLTAAVARAAEVLDYRARPGTVVLVTDGDETCLGATCRLATHLAVAGADLTVHVIGFRPRSMRFDGMPEAGAAANASACLAEATGGRSYTAETVEDLVDALSETLDCPLYGRLEVGRG